MTTTIIQPEINLAYVRESQLLSPRRVCFAYTHANALKRSSTPPYIGAFNLPFHNTIRPIFTEYTSLSLYFEPRFNGYWRSIQTEHEYETIQKFVESHRELVFMRDRLALSIALSSYKDDEGNLTTIGEYERNAKYNKDKTCIEQITELTIQKIASLPFYQNADVLCAVPPSTGQGINLPTEIVHNVSQKTGRLEICDCVYWAGNKPSLKQLPLDEKWAALESSDLQVKCDLSNKSIILVDDLYQSGTTIHYVSMKLIEHGARCVYGLCFVKARGDTDNLQND